MWGAGNRFKYSNAHLRQFWSSKNQPEYGIIKTNKLILRKIIKEWFAWQMRNCTNWFWTELQEIKNKLAELPEIKNKLNAIAEQTAALIEFQDWSQC